MSGQMVDSSEDSAGLEAKTNTDFGREEYCREANFLQRVWCIRFTEWVWLDFSMGIGLPFVTRQPDDTVYGTSF